MNQDNDPLIIRAQARLIYFGGIDRSTLAKWEKAGKVPPPIHVSKRVVGWRRSTLEAWIDGKASA